MSDDSPRFTLDTNLLVYSVDNTAGARHGLAIEIVDRATECDCFLTLQVLSEFYAAVTCKTIVRPAEAAAQVQNWLGAFRCTTASSKAVLTALTDAVAGRASYWDALLVATASEIGCKIMLSEDMTNGGFLGDVRICNPFASSGGLDPMARGLLGLDQPAD
jgi:predicted nucleic acid-binding protein